MLQGHARYQQALGTGEDVHAFASALTRGGYATDPVYAQKLVATAASVKALRSAIGRAVIQDAGRAADNGEWGILVSERTP